MWINSTKIELYHNIQLFTRKRYIVILVLRRDNVTRVNSSSVLESFQNTWTPNTSEKTVRTVNRDVPSIKDES